MKIRDFLIIIPARYSSSRFPGKPLAKIAGESMLSTVWKQCVKASSKRNVIVATDDKRIKNHCENQDMQVIMTSKRCQTGTDRVIEVSKKVTCKFYINVQGDEPLINVKDIKKIINYSYKYPKYILNGIAEINDKKDFLNKNIPKAVINNLGELMYMSRSPIPINKKGSFISAFKQVCIYSFPRDILRVKNIYNNKTSVENIEDIEILRFLEKGFKIKMIKLSDTSVAVDTPADLKRVKKIIAMNYV